MPSGRVAVLPFHAPDILWRSCSPLPSWLAPSIGCSPNHPILLYPTSSSCAQPQHPSHAYKAISSWSSPSRSIQKTRPALLPAPTIVNKKPLDHEPTPGPVPKQGPQSRPPNSSRYRFFAATQARPPLCARFFLTTPISPLTPPKPRSTPTHDTP